MSAAPRPIRVLLIDDQPIVGERAADAGRGARYRAALLLRPDAALKQAIAPLQ
jgi:hypothetical protein